jgi:hypothetical protein
MDMALLALEHTIVPLASGLRLDSADVEIDRVWSCGEEKNKTDMIFVDHSLLECFS